LLGLRRTRTGERKETPLCGRRRRGIMWGVTLVNKSETGKENEGRGSALTGLGDQSGWRLEDFFIILLDIINWITIYSYSLFFYSFYSNSCINTPYIYILIFWTL
jgi:hypothetical protein